jgi:hypothetical protein
VAVEPCLFDLQATVTEMPWPALARAGSVGQSTDTLLCVSLAFQLFACLQQIALPTILLWLLGVLKLELTMRVAAHTGIWPNFHTDDRKSCPEFSRECWQKFVSVSSDQVGRRFCTCINWAFVTRVSPDDMQVVQGVKTRQGASECQRTTRDPAKTSFWLEARKG